MELNEIYLLVGKSRCGVELTQEEINSLAFADLMSFYEDFNNDFDFWKEFKDEVENVVFDFLSRNGVEDDDRDEKYSDNLYHMGYTYNNRFYVTNYTGNAGNYWNGNNEYYICRP